MALTIMQEKFAKNIAAGMRKGEAAIAAGYSKKSAHSQATENSKNPKIIERIEEIEEEERVRAQRRLSHIAHPAISELVKVLQDPDTPPQTKTNTAKILLDYAGYKAVEKQDINNSGDIGIKVEWTE